MTQVKAIDIIIDLQKQLNIEQYTESILSKICE